jgi:hypothetical protein
MDPSCPSCRFDRGYRRNKSGSLASGKHKQAPRRMLPFVGSRQSSDPASVPVLPLTI